MPISRSQSLVPKNATPYGGANPELDMSVSPCKRPLPDTGQLCELLNRPHDNHICQRCSFRLGSPTINSTQAERLAEAAGISERNKRHTRQQAKKKEQMTTCGFVGCTELCKGKYCKPHLWVVNSRRYMHEGGSKNWPPETWDTVPVRPRAKNRGSQ